MIEEPIYIGKTYPWEPPPGLFTPGTPRWYAMRCAPLREEAAAKHLRDHGIKAFFPVKVRNVTVRGKPQERRQLMVPGYVFANVPGEPVWHRLFGRDTARRLIVDVIRMASGEPGRLQPTDLTELRTLADRDEEREEAERRRNAIKPGELVRHPLIEGLEGEVVSLGAKGGFLVRFTLFGSVREVEVEGDVEKVA